MNGKIILKWTDTKTVHFLYDNDRKFNKKDVIALRKPTYYLWRSDFSSQEKLKLNVRNIRIVVSGLSHFWMGIRMPIFTMVSKQWLEITGMIYHDFNKLKFAAIPNLLFLECLPHFLPLYRMLSHRYQMHSA